MHACCHGTYRGIGPSVVQLPPVEELLARVPRQLAFLLLPRELPPEAAQVAAVLVQEAVLQLLVLPGRAAGLRDRQAAQVGGFLLVFVGGTASLFIAIVIYSMICNIVSPCMLQRHHACKELARGQDGCLQPQCILLTIKSCNHQTAL